MDEVMKEVDETIKSVSGKIRKDNMSQEIYVETVKALAALVEARAKLK